MRALFYQRAILGLHRLQEVRLGWCSSSDRARSLHAKVLRFASAKSLNIISASNNPPAWCQHGNHLTIEIRGFSACVISWASYAVFNPPGWGGYFMRLKHFDPPAMQLGTDQVHRSPSRGDDLVSRALEVGLFLGPRRLQIWIYHQAFLAVV